MNDKEKKLTPPSPSPAQSKKGVAATPYDHLIKLLLIGDSGIWILRLTFRCGKKLFVASILR
jgi:hypothetical protein